VPEPINPRCYEVHSNGASRLRTSGTAGGMYASVAGRRKKTQRWFAEAADA
jgi:hypothetical protein